MTEHGTPYPLRMDAPVSRGLWLVKWLLALPHPRWALRVAAYAALMTDRYPPFRLNVGRPDPGWVPAVPPSPQPAGAPAASGGSPLPAAVTPGATGPAGLRAHARAGLEHP